MLGTVKLTAKDLPWWQKDGEQWPVDSATSEKLFRFRWGESHTHEDNYRGLQTIFRYICAKGAEFSPASAKALRAISDEELLDRVQTKYQDLQKALWAAKLLLSSRITTTTEASENQGTLRDAKLSKGVRQSRQQGKCEVREQKFAALSDDSEFKTDAFKTALIPQLMSEDDDETNEEGHLTRRYISCPWVWASEQRNQFIAAVDAQQDPHPPKHYTIRVRGKTLDVTILEIQKVEHHARRWMVSQEWLAQPENQKYDDPEETISVQKRVKIQKKEVAARRRVKLVDKGNTKPGKGKKKAGSKKDKGKARAIDVDEEPTQPKNTVPAQPVASTSIANQMVDNSVDSDFED
ncbi:uncharacterized protein F5891DRAFT_1188322 [Suillus fuscotomentosus]|uniref:Uncharacterized protein n=1 Tax=Suillus fuscotomentosus TaxID=1912939 RepID=A0AAD4E6V2_9AGAM|nr:uncharacterized protein F5891DRAFT_1188322 [Suillus fuscotomentosus]KAG1900835.1 hypothetical protein F5891DRAFT_1188322 [Suillus fuscotomentosus]